MSSSDPVDNPADGSADNPAGSPVDNPLADEVRRLALAVGGRAERAYHRFRDDHPDVHQHLAAAGSELVAAGSELVAAYRAAVVGHERRWSAPEKTGSERIDVDG